MGTHVETTNDVVTLKMSGNFFGDKETDELREVFRRLASAGNQKLVLDLGRVSRMNSMALGLLVQIHTNYVNRGGRIILANTDNLHDLLTITRLSRVFEIGPSLSEAMAKFGQ